MTRDEYGVTCHKHQPAMIEHAALYVLDRDVARDIVALSIEKGLKQCGRITRASFRKYMLEAVRGHALNYLELHQHRWEVPSQVDEDGSPLQDAAVSTNDDVRIDIIMAINSLPVRLKAVAILHYCEELTQVELALLRGCTQPTIHHLIQEINQHLRVTLAAYRTGRTTCENKLSANQ